MKRHTALLALLCLFFRAAALQVGDKLPGGLTVAPVLNSGSTQLPLSAFRGKLLIIDFWATNCASCIAAIPRLDSLQQEFAGKVSILTVSYEKKAIVERFLTHNPTGRAMKLPVVTDDKQLAALFPHRELSHEVWIDSGGRVIAITGAEYVDRTHVQRYLSGLPLDLPLKQDFPALDHQKPILSAQRAPLYYSMLGAYKNGVPVDFGTVNDPVNHTTRLWVVNFPVVSMYLLAFNHLGYFPKTLMQISTKDSSLVRAAAGEYHESWKKKHWYCYEAVMPGDLSFSALQPVLVKDINRFFGLNGRMEKKQVTALSLERLPGNNLPVSKGGIPLNTLHGGNGTRRLVNASLSNIVWELNDLAGGLPAVDNTGITINIDLELPSLTSFADLTTLNKALQPYGLVVNSKMQELEMFVLTDAETFKP